MNIEDMSWTEVEEKLKDTQTVLIPVSPLEQHGPHLPVKTNYFRAYEVCKKAAEKTGVFCMPPIPLGVLNKGYAYAGSVSVSGETLKNVIVDVCRSLKDNGFKRIIIISGHGGSVHPNAINQAIEELGEDVSFFKASEFQEGSREDLIETEKDWHAGERESSEMLYLDAESVDMEKATSFFPDYPEGEVEKSEYRKVNPTGVMGDATKATKEKGKEIIETAIENLVKVIENG